MKINLTLTKVLLVVFILIVRHVSLFSQDRDTLDFYPNKLYVSFKENVKVEDNAKNGKFTNNKKIDNLLSKFEVKTLSKAFNSKSKSLSCIYIVECKNETILLEELLKMKSYINYAEKIPKKTIDFTPNDYYYNGDPLWYLEKLQARSAWDISGQNATITIGIVDNGFEVTHDDLENQIIYAHGNVSPISGDSRHHGTAVASIAAMQTNNNLGYSSIAGMKAKLMVFKGLNYNNLLEAANRGAKVINASWGSSEWCESEQETINELHARGVIIVSTAGNTSNSTYRYPASYDHVISVAALVQDDSKRSNSNYNDKVDISAPGEAITAAKLNNTYYHGANSTSAAAPLVSGVCALCLSANPSLNPDEVERIIEYTADNIYDIPGNSQYQGMLGAGRINAYKAVRKSVSKHIQNQNLYGNQVINSAYDIYAGKNVLNPNNIGLVKVKSGSNIVFDSQEVYLDCGFEVELGANFEIN